MTSDPTGRPISSPGSEDGHTLSTLPDGPVPGLSGPPPVPVSRFRAQANDVAMPTTDTSGPLFGTLSPSFDLQCSLESRLRAVMDVNGSPEYVLIWSSWDMPAGPAICRLRASARPTSGSASTSLPSGWPTPNAGPQNDHGHEMAGAAGEDQGREEERQRVRD